MKKFLSVLLGATALFATPALANDTLRIVTIPIVDTLPMYVAKDAGIFAKHGLDVTFIPAANQTIVMSALTSGSAEIGNAVAPSMLQAREAGIETQIICDGASFPYPQPLHVGLVAREGSNIHSAADLVGKKIAVIGINGYHHVLVKRWLEEKGVDPSKVNFVEVTFPQMGDVLKGGSIDAATSIDPFYNRILANHIGYVFDNFIATVPDGTLIDFYVVQKNWAATHRDQIERVRESITESIAYIKAHEAEARASLAASTKQPPEVVATTSLPDFKMAVKPEQVKFWIDLAHHQGLISQDYDPASFVWQP